MLGGGGFGTALGEREHAIDGIPELGEGLIEIKELVTGGSGLGEGGFVLNGVGEVGADAFELRDPGDDRVWLCGILHVAHGQGQGVEIVLDAKELERIAAIAIYHFALEFADSRELEGDVAGVCEDSEDGDDEAEVKAAGRGVLTGRRVWHREKDIT